MSYTASPRRYTNTGRRAVLVSLFGPSYLTVICSLFLVRQWIQFMSVSFGFCGNRDRYAQCLLCLFREISQMQFLDGVLALRCATTGAGWFGHPCCCAEAVPHGPFVHAPGAVLGQGFLVSFTVPLNDWTIVATAVVVPSCSSSADCPAAREFASRCRVDFSLLVVLMIRFGTV